MKIVMITDTYPPNVNGAALATERLVHELAERNHTIFVIAPSTSFKSHITHEKNVTIYRVKSIPLFIEKTQEFRVSPKPFHSKEIRTIIQQIKPDIIHINEPWLMGLSGIKIGKDEHIPVVATHHFMPENLVHHLHLGSKLENMIHVSIWKWYAKICRNFSVVICPTPKAAELIKRYGNGVNLEVISNGIDLNEFNKTNDGAYLKKRFGFPNKPIILFVGRLDKEKNIDVLIRAGSLLKEKADFHMVIVGQGKEINSLKKLAGKLGLSPQTTFTGYLPKEDLPFIYTTADVFVIPSIAELQSLVTMEAMASGLPIIAADAVALPHLVHNNQNGFLFKPGDEYDFSEKLLILLQDKKLREAMSKESLEIIQDHDIHKIVKKVEETYKRTISNFNAAGTL
jgi:1,2-diacylglycerol 3-alpha-glucosyltransferase